MKYTYKLIPVLAVLSILSLGCVTNSQVVTDPPGMLVSINGKDFGPSPCDIQSVGTTFSNYRLQLNDPQGNFLFEEDLPKSLRFWGLFWPPYGVFYNFFEFYPK